MNEGPDQPPPSRPDDFGSETPARTDSQPNPHDEDVQSYRPWDDTTRDRHKVSNVAADILREVLAEKPELLQNRSEETKDRMRAAPAPPQRGHEQAESPAVDLSETKVRTRRPDGSLFDSSWPKTPQQPGPPPPNPMASADIPTLMDRALREDGPPTPQMSPPPVPCEADQPAPHGPGPSTTPAAPGLAETVQFPANPQPAPADPDEDESIDPIRGVGTIDVDDDEDGGTVDVEGPPPSNLPPPIPQGRTATKDLKSFNVAGSPDSGRDAMAETKAQAGTTIRSRKAPGPGDNLQYFGDYELLSELARGGMGVVYRARQRTLGRMVALKMILAGTLATDYAVRRFLIEAEAAARLDHPNIVPIYEIGEFEGLHYFSMKFVEGHSLAAITKKLARDPRRAAMLIAKVARAVGHAHQRGILHRDLKPANILIDEDGEPHVTDFGLAKIVAEGQEGQGLTMEGSVMGTPSYMAPEQAEGKSATLTTLADVWGLGAILYDCLTAQPPFKGDTALATVAMVRSLEPRPPSAINPETPSDLATICLKCLQKDPAKRYATAEALAADLENWLEGRPISARPIGRVERAVMWARRHPALAALSGAVVLSVVLGMAGVLWQWSAAVKARKAESIARQIAEQRAVEVQQQALRIRRELNRSELLRGRMLLQSGDADLAEGVLWSAALGAPNSVARYQSTTMPLTAGPMTPQEWALWDLYRQRPRQGALPGARAMAMALSDDARLLATVSADHLTVIDRIEGRTVLSADTTATLLSQPAIAPGNALVAAADYVHGHVLVYDLQAPSENAKLRMMIAAPEAGPDAAVDAGDPARTALLKSNPRIVFVDRDRLLVWNRLGLELRDTRNGALLAWGLPAPTGANPGDDVAVTIVPRPDNAPHTHMALVAFGTELRPIRRLDGDAADLLIWDDALVMEDEGRARRPVKIAQAGRDMAIAVLTPGGALVAAATDGTSIAEVRRLGRDEVPRLDEISLSPDAQTLVGRAGRSYFAWSFPELRLLRSGEALGGGPPSGIAALPRNAGAILAEFDQSVANYSTAEPRQQWLRRGPAPIGSFVFDVGAAGPAAVLPVGERGPLQLWENNRATELRRLNPEEPGLDMAVRITDDATSLAILTALNAGPAIEFHPARQASAATPRLLRLDAPSHEIPLTMGISADGSLLAAATSGRILLVRADPSAPDGIRQDSIPVEGIVSDISITDCATTVAAFSRGMVHLVHAADLTSHPVELGSNQLVYNSAFSDDGALLSAPTGEQVLLIGVARAKVAGSLASSTGGQMVAGAFTPMGGLMATATRAGRVLLWDVATGQEIAALDPGAGALSALRFAPDGHQLRWWGEKASGTIDLSEGFDRLALNLADRLPLVIPAIHAQDGAEQTLKLLEALRPYAPVASAQIEAALQQAKPANL